MNSIKTKTNSFSIHQGKAIAAVLFLPAGDYFLIYVVWEWPKQAQNNFFAVVESPHLIGDSIPDIITYVADYGNDVTHDANVRSHFPHIFKS